VTGSRPYGPAAAPGRKGQSAKARRAPA
jgi:hypothetical protein